MTNLAKSKLLFSIIFVVPVILASTPAATDQNCAVSTAPIGTVDVTEFFGVRGGAASFSDSFVNPAGQLAGSELSQTPALRCIRLEVENPTHYET